MTLSSKRAEHLAAGALAMGIVFFALTLLLGLWSGFYGLFALSWFFLGSVLIWLVLVLQFHQRALAEQEKLDSGRLTDSGSGRIFHAEETQKGLLTVAQRRVSIFEKWVVGILSALICAYELGIGVFILRLLPRWEDAQAKEPLFCAVLLTGVAFVSFILSRYATGMSSELVWKPLRAGGSFLLGAALLCFALAISLVAANYKFTAGLFLISRAVPLLLIVLGAETGLNFVLDIYRPRLKGQYHRAAFDSRLLGLISEPGGILKTAASAIDYQFGFKVSQTWFYKLLEKAIVPLILFGGITLYLFSCIVTLGPDEEGIIEHFGNPCNSSNEVRLIGPGLTFKWPWPIDICYKYPTRKISEISIGFVPKQNAEGGYEPLLWGKAHYEKEYKLLVASEAEAPGPDAIPVSLVMAAVPVQYRINDLYAFLYNHGVRKKPDGTMLYGAQQRLEAICYNELTKFAARSTIEVGEAVDDTESLLGAGRNRAKEVLMKNIQAAATAAGLGIEIVFVGVQGIHPPPELASDYQRVIGAVQHKQAAILSAQAARNRTLGYLAGSVDEAKRLYSLADEYLAARGSEDPRKIEQAAIRLDQAFSEANGEIFAKLRESKSYSYQKATITQAEAERFQGQLKAYRAAPEIYKRRQRLAALVTGLENIRKFVVVADHNDTQVSIIDLQEKLTPGLYEWGEIGESASK